MDITRAIAIQFDILNAVYSLIGIIVIGAIAVVGTMYLYSEYKEYQRKRTTTNKKPWL
jgi:hypothetical protein